MNSFPSQPAQTSNDSSSVNNEHGGPRQAPTAIVTGAARAIGQRIAQVLARDGFHVACIDLEDSTNTVGHIERAGGTAMSHRADVTDEKDLDAAVTQVMESRGSVDVLVNNAGLFASIPRRPFWEIDEAEWDQVLRVNTKSVFVCAKTVSEVMRQTGRGRIVNIASNVSTFGMANQLHYVASKAAVVGITRSLARELGPYNVAVNAVAPGLVTTEITERTVPAEYRQQVAQGQCLEQPLTPDDIAEAVAYLASPRARLITGQTLLVNGGATMSGA